MFRKLKRIVHKKYIVKKEESHKIVLKKIIFVIAMSAFTGIIVFFTTKSALIDNAKEQFNSDALAFHHSVHKKLQSYQELSEILQRFAANNNDSMQFSTVLKALQSEKYSQLSYINYVGIKNLVPLIEESINNEYILKQNSKVTVVNDFLFFNNVNKNLYLTEHKDKSYIYSNEILPYMINENIVQNYETVIFSKIYGNSNNSDYSNLYFKKHIYDDKYKGFVTVGLLLNQDLFQEALSENPYLGYQLKTLNLGKNAKIILQNQETRNTKQYHPLFNKKLSLADINPNLELEIYSEILPPYLADQKYLYILSITSFLAMLLLLCRVLHIYKSNKSAYELAREMTEQLRMTAYTDSLTGLANRQAFLENINDSIEQNPESEIYVMFLDLDGFKKVNDTLGHAAGDIILSNFALRLRKLAKNEPIKCYRIGGDEFIVVVEVKDSPVKINKSDIEDLAKNLLLLTKQSFAVSEEEFSLSVSIGIALYPHDGINAKDLIKHSDMAMYETKKKGKNNYAFYAEDIVDNDRNNTKIGNMLLEALDNKEFYLVYQPKMHKVEGRYYAIGAEVLLRWKNEELGEILPAQFIKIAENLGLMPTIGLWVFEESLKKLSDWKKSGIHNITLSLNMSFLQFSDMNLKRTFLSLLELYEIDPSCLIIEVTESTMMQDIDTARGLLKELASIGLKVSIDDFGTGYSSLTYLRNYPVDEIKIDRSFTTDMLENSKDRIFISAIIELAQNLGVNIVIEGVENYEQVKWFENKGSLHYQGYYFSKPLQEKEFVKFLDNNHRDKIKNNDCNYCDL